VTAKRQELLDRLEAYYRSCGWKVNRGRDGTVRAVGPGDVTWIGLAVVPEDLTSDQFVQRLMELAAQRMPAGALCPLELLPAAECVDDLRATLAELELDTRGNVAVYSLAA
jgi:hypothetical protein